MTQELQLQKSCRSTMLVCSMLFSSTISTGKAVFYFPYAVHSAKLSFARMAAVCSSIRLASALESATTAASTPSPNFVCITQLHKCGMICHAPLSKQLTSCVSILFRCTQDA